MKRKPPAGPEPLIAPEIIEGAKRSLETDRIKPPVKCSVCGAEATPNPNEQLCWVCRRLKISAWRDVEQQMPAQE
jgi:Zn finger protein HypA/HybF involved in hydrogenase expression